MKENKIQEIKLVENNLQNLLIQKQFFQIEIAETESALKELENSGDEVFKIIGQLMVKSEKEKIIKELLDKKKLLELRLKSIENQEKLLENRIKELNRDI